MYNWERARLLCEDTSEKKKKIRQQQEKEGHMMHERIT